MYAFTLLMFFVIIICVDGIGINPAQTAGRCLYFTRSGLPSAAASGCNKCHFVSCKLFRYIQISHRAGNVLPVQMHVNACLFVCWWCFNPPSIFFKLPLPCILSFYETRYLITLSPFTCVAEISCLSFIITRMQMNGSFC